MAELNVRKEAWYSRYYQTVASGINNAHRKYPDATIILVGIEGDVQYGKRTLQEWTYLQEDIDKHILDGKISKRPSNMRISFENFQQMVGMLAAQPNTYVLVASCPARIGDNYNVMEDVREITSGKPWSAKVDLVFSSADSAASAEFYNMQVAPVDGSGGAAAAAAAATGIANMSLGGSGGGGGGGGGGSGLSSDLEALLAREGLAASCAGLLVAAGVETVRDVLEFDEKSLEVVETKYLKFVNHGPPFRITPVDCAAFWTVRLMRFSSRH